LDTIASVALALHQYEGSGSSALRVVSETAEGLLEESTAGTELAVVVSPPSPIREGAGASLPQPAEVVTAAPTASVVGVAEGVVGEVGPSSPRSVAAAVEEVLVSGHPAVAPQERVALEGTTRAVSPEIQEAEEGLGAVLSQGAASSEAVDGR
jgi:hypothetical protein